MKLQGAMVAIVTPLRDDEPDLASLARARRVADPRRGPTASSPAAPPARAPRSRCSERADVIRTVVETARGRVKVIAGAGSNATAEAVEGVKLARELGADAALVVTPYYNKPTQEGLYRHYMKIWDAAGFPVVAYNVPSRTSVDLLPETVERLVKAGAIAGIKEATANMDRQVQLVERCGRDAIAYLSGDDFTVLPYIACGGHGVISVIGNIAPRAMKELVVAAVRGDHAAALAQAGGHGRAQPGHVRRDQPGPGQGRGGAARARPGRRSGCRSAQVSRGRASPKIRDAMVRFGLVVAA